MADKDKKNSKTSTIGELTEAVSVLKDSAKGFNQAAGLIESSVNKLIGNMKSSENVLDDDLEDKLSQLEGISNKHITRAQSVATNLINTFGKVASYAISKFTDAGNRIIANYNDSLTAITVRQNLSNKEYTERLMSATNWIRDNDLKTQFSQIDWTSSLQDALSAGLRDDVAERVATQNMITKKLLPQLSLNSRTYTRASKLLGDSLSQNITAIGKYTEQVYGAEGLEDNQVNNVLETIMNEIIASGARNGLSEKEVSNQVANVLGTYQQYSAQYGAQYAENVLGSLKGIMTGDLSDTMANMAMSDANINIGDASSLNADSLAKFFESYTRSTRQLGSGAGAGVMANMAGIGQYDNYLAVIASDAYGAKYKDWMGNLSDTVDAATEYNKELGKLTEGYYQNITDQQTKWNENAVSGVSDWLAQHIPDVQGILSMIGSILGLWWADWKAQSLIRGATGGGYGGVGGQGLMSLFSQGGKFALTKAPAAPAGGSLETLLTGKGVSGSLGMNSTLTGLGTGLSIASIVAGAAMMIGNGIKGMNDERMQGNKAGAFFANAFNGGSSTYGYSDKDKMAVQKERNKQWLGLDWKAVGKSAGAGALVGVGAGALVGGAAGGIGAAPGAIIGGLLGGGIGAASSIITQKAEMDDYNKILKKGIGSFTEALGESTSKLNDNVQLLTEVSGLQDEISTLKEDLKDTSDLSALEIAQKENQLRVDEQLLEVKLKQLSMEGENLEEIAKQQDELLNQAETLAEFSNKFGEGSFDSMTDFMSSLGVKGYDENAGIGKTIEKDYETVLSNLGGQKSVNTLLESLGFDKRLGNNQEENEKILTNLIMSMAKTQGLDNATVGHNYGGLRTVGTEALLSVAQDAYNAVGESQAAADQLATVQGASTRDTYNSEDEWFEKERQAISYRYSSVSPDNYKGSSVEEIVGGVATSFTDEDIARYLSWVKNNKSTAWRDSKWSSTNTVRFFKLGSDYITANNQPAILHKGEAVLTASAAEKLRKLSGNSAGISGFIEDLWSLRNSKASAVGEATTISFDPIVSAIKEQTAELKESLDEIAILVSTIINPTPEAHVDQRLISYQGAGG